mgnify:FL=1
MSTHHHFRLGNILLIFDDNTVDFKVYGKEVRTERTDSGYEGRGQLIDFDRSCVDSWDSAAIADFDKDTDFERCKMACRENKRRR